MTTIYCDGGVDGDGGHGADGDGNDVIDDIDGWVLWLSRTQALQPKLQQRFHAAMSQHIRCLFICKGIVQRKFFRLCINQRCLISGSYRPHSPSSA